MPATPPVSSGAERPLTVVALSGGVDSATAAALLVEAGERVVGVSMRLYDAGGTSASVGGRCCGPRDLEDARRVADHLGIPFYVADYADDFARTVVDDFVAEYARGRTPNPCVRCNQHVKFTPLLRRARALGATSLATGHYARLVDVPDAAPDGDHAGHARHARPAPETGGRLLARARDAAKDQSYFLFNMPPGALPFVRFPVGGMTKEEVRGHAKRLGLPVADKEDSQEICFVPDGNHAEFVARRAALPAGEIVDSDGRTLGRHDGVHRFTVGQRRGLGSLPIAPGSQPGPRYVLALDARAGRVTVGSAAELGRASCVVEDVVWWRAPSLAGAGTRLAVQIRHRHRAAAATVEPLDGQRARVTFDSPERAVAPGQAAVFYDGDLVVGGGFLA